jgi:hypothetical protein
MISGHRAPAAMPINMPKVVQKETARGGGAVIYCIMGPPRADGCSSRPRHHMHQGEIVQGLVPKHPHPPCGALEASGPRAWVAVEQCLTVTISGLKADICLRMGTRTVRPCLPTGAPDVPRGQRPPLDKLGEVPPPLIHPGDPPSLRGVQKRSLLGTRESAPRHPHLEGSASRGLRRRRKP